MFGKILSDTGVYSLSKLSVGLLGLFLIPLFIKYFGIENYAAYTTILFWVTLINALLTGWVNQSFLRYYCDPGATKKLFDYNIWGFVLSVIPVVMARYFFHISVSVPVLLFFVASFSFYGLNRVVLQTKTKSMQYLLTDLVRAVFMVFGPVSLMLLFPGMLKLDQMFLGVSVGNIVPLIGMNFREWRDSESTSIFSIDKSWVVYGAPLGFWLCFSSSLLVIDRSFIQSKVGASAGDGYLVVYDLLLKAYTLFFVPLTMAIYPFLVKQYSLDPAKVARLFRVWYPRLLLVGLGIGAFISLMFGWLQLPVLHLLRIRIKHPLMPYQAVLLSLGIFVWQFSMLTHKFLELSQKTIYMLISIAVAVTSHFVVIMWLAPALGLTAFPIANISSAAIYTIMVFGFTLVAIRKEAMKWSH
jgi:hypothetical protein